jgi:hypothetical protein
MEKKGELKGIAFNILQRGEKNLEGLIDTSLSIEDFGNLEIGGIIEREFAVDARENSAIKMLTINIVGTYKKCNHEFSYEELNKPRRELTVPSEGKSLIYHKVF